MRKGGLVVHAGGRPVLVDQFGGSLLTSAALNSPPEPAADVLVTDDGRRASIRCVGPKDAGIGEQLVDLDRPARLSILCTTERPLTWWYAGKPEHRGNSLTWADGTKLTVTRGAIVRIDPNGRTDATRHYGGMKYADPHAFTYPVITVAPTDEKIEVEVVTPQANAKRSRKTGQCAAQIAVSR